MTDTQHSMLVQLRSIQERLLEIEPAHPHTPGLFRRHSGIIHDLYRTGLNRDQIDEHLDSL